MVVRSLFLQFLLIILPSLTWVLLCLLREGKKYNLQGIFARGD